MAAGLAGTAVSESCCVRTRASNRRLSETSDSLAPGLRRDAVLVLLARQNRGRFMSIALSRQWRKRPP